MILAFSDVTAVHPHPHVTTKVPIKSPIQTVPDTSDQYRVMALTPLPTKKIGLYAYWRLYQFWNDILESEFGPFEAMLKMVELFNLARKRYMGRFNGEELRKGMQRSRLAFMDIGGGRRTMADAKNDRGRAVWDKSGFRPQETASISLETQVEKFDALQSEAIRDQTSSDATELGPRACSIIHIEDTKDGIYLVW